MKWNHFLGLGIALSFAVFQPAIAATNFWQEADASYQERSAGDDLSVNVLVNKGRRLTADPSQMELELLSGDNVDISLPLPDGSMVIYQLSKSSVMPEELALKYPQIQTFKGFDTNNPANSGSFDITPQGFHGMFHHDGKWVFIDPEVRNDNGNYIAYFGSDAKELDSRPLDEVIHTSSITSQVTSNTPYSNRPLVGTSLRTYRLAMAASGEYTAFHGGKVNALAAINTLVNRINEVYERDLSIKFVLVANNDDIIYTNRITDPYTNTSNDATANSTSLPTVIANADFDIGHVVNTGGGGLAYLGGVCTNVNKSIGVTGRASPTGDAFYIDYVAHELGHQLGANHTFNGTAAACSGGNRKSSAAWEPGSGSTIMGYAGICGAQNLQASSDAYFHTGSIEEMLTVANAGSCGTVTAITNAIPVADAGADFTIPANMPFKLTGTGSDTNTGDSLTYTWEQFDTGTASSGVASMIDNGSRPLFRSRSPSTSPERYFPNLVDYAANSLKIGETMPTTSRDLNFRLTVRDGKGGVATDAMKVTVVPTTGTFQITEPASGVALVAGSAVTLRWTVAGTASAPYSCSTVDILISEGGSDNFAVTSVTGTPNDGEHAITLSSGVTSNSAIMLRCSTSGLVHSSTDS